MNRYEIIKNNKNDVKILYMDFDNDSYKNNFDEHSISNFVIYGKNKKTIIKLANEENKESNKDVEMFVESRLGRMAQLVFKMLYDNEDPDDGDLMIILDEIEKLKRMLDIKFKHDLAIEKYNEYVENLYFLRQEINNKISTMNYESSYRSGR